MEETQLIVEAIEELKNIVFWSNLSFWVIGIGILWRLPRK